MALVVQVVGGKRDSQIKCWFYFLTSLIMVIYLSVLPGNYQQYHLKTYICKYLRHLYSNTVDVS